MGGISSLRTIILLGEGKGVRTLFLLEKGPDPFSMNDTEKVKQLTEYFTNRDDVVMAFLFGSRAGGQARKRSDWDIGVYLSEENREKEREIWMEAERILGGETDLIILNRAPATLAWQIVGRGEVLIIKNRNIYLDFIFRVSEEANAFYQTSERYYRIFQRSASLSAIDRKRHLSRKQNHFGRNF